MSVATRRCRRAALVRVAVRASANATAVGFLPTVYLAVMLGGEAVGVFLIGVTGLFVVGVVAYEVVREWGCPTVTAPPPLPSRGPGRVFSQAEAGLQLNALINEFWERDECRS